MVEHAMPLTEAGPPASAERSIWDNFRDVVLAPSDTFEDARERPRWLIPLLVIMGATLVVSYFLMPLYSEMQRAGVMASDMSPEQQEQALRGMEAFKWIGLAAGPIMVAIVTALISGGRALCCSAASALAVANRPASFVRPSVGPSNGTSPLSIS